MPLVDMKDMLRHAYENGYAVGAFDLINLEFLQGVLNAAERCRAPVVLSLAESHFDICDPELLLPAMETAARRADVPVAIHFDHGHSLESAVKAINLGCNGIMVDASHESFPDNIRITSTVAEMARGCGVAVEGELGYVPGVEGDDAERHPGKMTCTTAAEAKSFVSRTGVDFLAVSIGTVHGRMKGKPKLDFQRLKQINESLGIPLVIHGGTGLSDEQYRKLIANGVAKINYYTALNDAAGESLGRQTQANDNLGMAAMTSDVVLSVEKEAERCMRLWGAGGRAAEVLAWCTPWRPVEHLIIYNVQGVDEEDARRMMAEGRRVLAALPGVRAVLTGEAVKQDAKYQYTWLIRFCHPAVIESYRVHPAHVAFADKHFRPVAGDRISIDYLLDWNATMVDPLAADIAGPGQERNGNGVRTRSKEEAR